MAKAGPSRKLPLGDDGRGDGGGGRERGGGYPHTASVLCLGRNHGGRRRHKQRDGGRGRGWGGSREGGGRGSRWGGGRGKGEGGRGWRRVTGREGVEGTGEGGSGVMVVVGRGGSFRPVTPPCFFGQVGREVQAIQKKIIDGKPTAGESGGRRERKKEGGREGPAWLEAAVQDERR